MNEVISESRNEKAIKAAILCKFNSGISNHFEENPEKKNLSILKSFTIRVTKYSAIAELSHLKRPNVTRFKGSINIFITGLAKR